MPLCAALAAGRRPPFEVCVKERNDAALRILGRCLVVAGA